MTTFSRAGLVVRSNDASVADTLIEVIACLKALDIEPVPGISTQGLVGDLATHDLDEIGRRCDVAIVIGGDGTLLDTARRLVDHQVPIVGVNRGRLGFLVDVSPDDGMDALRAILTGDFHAESRALVKASLVRDGAVLHSSYALNDAVIRVRDLLRLMDFDIVIDGVLVTHQRADGLIVATPSGSTAYSLSNGGPIVGPTIDALLLQPICPHMLSSRPLLVDGNSRIEIRLKDDERASAQLVCDGQVYIDAQLGDTIVVERLPRALPMLHPADYDYHRILREKLNWA